MNKTPNTLRRPVMDKDLETGEIYEEVLEVQIPDVRWMYRYILKHLKNGCTFQEAIEKEFTRDMELTKYDEDLKEKLKAYHEIKMNK